MDNNNVTITTVTNWDKYVETGDNRFLNDAASLHALAKGTHVVIAGEGWEREAVLA